MVCEEFKYEHVSLRVNIQVRLWRGMNPPFKLNEGNLASFKQTLQTLWSGPLIILFIGIADLNLSVTLANGLAEGIYDQSGYWFRRSSESVLECICPVWLPRPANKIRKNDVGALHRRIEEAAAVGILLNAMILGELLHGFSQLK